MLFKLIHGLAEVSSITLTPLTSCTCGHSRHYAISPPIRTETYLHSFLHDFSSKIMERSTSITNDV